MGWQDSFQPQTAASAMPSGGGWQDSFQPEVPEANLTHEAGRQLGLAGRYVAEGNPLTSIPLMVGDAANAAVNYGIKGINKVAGSQIPELMPASQAFSQELTNAGLPEPQTSTERVVGDMSRAVAGAGTSIGAGAKLAENAASPYMEKLAEMLTSAPKTQVASSAMGAGAGGITREEGGGPTAQIAASLLAGSVLPAAQYSGAMGVRGAYRGGQQGANTMQDNIKAFASAGTTPTVGQATEARTPQFLESLLAKTPGSAGVMVNKANQQGQNISNNLEEQAASLAPKTTATTTGRMIDRGISGDGGFIQQFKDTQKQLYDKLDAHIPLTTPIDVSNTKAAISAVNADIPGAPNISKYFQNSKIAGIGNALDEDTKRILGGYGETGNTLPYEAVKKLRTLVGNEMADNSLVSEVPNSKWKALYAGLSQDMEAAANQAGPQATNAWNRANNYTRAGMERIDLLNGIVGKDTPEQIFQAATSGTREGATNLRAVMQSLPKPAQQAVTANVIRRLGIATPGNQNELGDVFSTNTFLTNWNKLSPEARQTLFGRYGAEFQQNMDRVAQVAANLREGSKVFANPSGTAQATAQKGLIGGVAIPLLSGHPGYAGLVGAGAGSANLYARLVTNPNFVKWLAENTQKPIQALPTAVNNLAQWAAKNNDQDSLAAARILSQQTNNPENKQ